MRAAGVILAVAAALVLQTTVAWYATRGGAVAIIGRHFGDDFRD